MSTDLHARSSPRPRHLAGVGLSRPRTIVAFLVAIALLAASGTARADEPGPPGGPGAPLRGPHSSRQGIVPAPSVTTAKKATNITVTPGPGDTFTPFVIVSMQADPMIKVLRDGTVDPDQALALWGFELDFEPTGDNPPCWFGFYEMPDGEPASVALAQPCDQTYTELPADLGERLLAATRGGLTLEDQLGGNWEQFEEPVLCAQDNPDDEEGGDGDNGEVEACTEENLLEAMEEVDLGGVPPPVLEPGDPPPGPNAPAPGAAAEFFCSSLVQGTDDPTEAAICLALAATVFAGTGGVALKMFTNPRNPFSLVPCFGRTAQVWGAMLATSAFLTVAATTPNPTVRRTAIVTAMAAFGFGIFNFVLQLAECYEVGMLGFLAAGWGGAAIATAASMAVFTSGALILVNVGGFWDIDSVRHWWSRR